MFQPQPTPSPAFPYGLGPDITSFAFHSSALSGTVHDDGTQSGCPLGSSFLYDTAAQPTSSSFQRQQQQPISSPAPAPPTLSSSAAAPAPHVLAHHHPHPKPTASSPLAPDPSHPSRRLQHRPRPPSRAHMRQQQSKRHQQHHQHHQHQHHQNQHQHQHQHQQQPHYALRNQVKMEGDLQQLSEIAAQEAAARDYKVEHQVPYVGEKTSSEAITEEYAKADDVYVQKTITLPEAYPDYRPIRGDGNCGWRAIAFSYFEYLIGTGDRHLVEAELARLTSANNFLVQNGYELSLFEDMVQETLDLLKDLACNIANPTAAMAALMTRFTDESLDNSIIYHMRLLAGACLKSDPTPYASFFTEATGGVAGYLHNTIEVPYQEIDQVGLFLLVKMLLEPAGLGLEIAYLDRSEGSEVNTYRIPDVSDAQITTTLCLLFRPNHYDIIYRRAPPAPPAAIPTSIQVHRAGNFTQHLQIASTPAGMANFGHTDMSPLADMLAGLGSTQGNSPLGLLPQAPPLSETFSQASQSVWPIMDTFATPLAQPPLQRPLSPTAAQPTPVMEADLDRQVRYSKYNYPELVNGPGYPELPFQTTAFRNSLYNKAHYNNPNFQPEEYNPGEESWERVSHKKKNCMGRKESDSPVK